MITKNPPVILYFDSIKRENLRCVNYGGLYEFRLKDEWILVKNTARHVQLVHWAHGSRKESKGEHYHWVQFSHGILEASSQSVLSREQQQFILRGSVQP